jgi:hypothetical protein
MSERELKDMIEKASVVAERAFKAFGKIAGLYHMVTAGGEQILAAKPFPNNKDLSAAAMRLAMREKNVVRYCYFDEGWLLRVAGPKLTEEQMMRFAAKGLADEPGRQEIIMFTAEDCERQVTARRVINRSANGKATLGPLIVDEPCSISEGRMIGMLQPPGKMQ